jgi:hypothetical protein
MSVTVAIPTTGDRPVLRPTVDAAIRSAAALSADAEVLVMVNGRDDAPGLGRIDSPALRLAYLPRPNRAGARNAALKLAKHDTVLLLDDDVSVSGSWCAELGTALQTDGCVVATVPVRTWVHGPITAFINYQQVFDSQAPGPADPGSLVTANCGLRRDRLPGPVRFDENLAAGDDTDFGYQLWRAGLRFEIVASAAPVIHELPEQILPQLERSMRYGNSTAMLSMKWERAAGLLPRFLAWFTAMAGEEQQDLRTFGEFTSPGVRAAFSSYAFILNSAYVIGCLARLGPSQDRPALRPDREGLLAAWAAGADQAGSLVSDLSPADWRELACDYSRLLHADQEATAPVPAAVSIITELKRALRSYALVELAAAADPAGPDLAGLLTAAAGSEGSARPGGPGDNDPSRAGHLDAALEELKQRPGPVSRADLDELSQVTGISFRLLLQIIERKVRASSSDRSAA